MKKPSFIIGKKQVILSCLTLMLAVAVYVNYALSDSDLTGQKKAQETRNLSMHHRQAVKRQNPKLRILLPQRKNSLRIQMHWKKQRQMVR